MAWFDSEDRGSTESLAAAASSRGRPLRVRSSGRLDGPSSARASQRSILIAGKDSSSNGCTNMSASSSVCGVGTGDPIARFRKSSISLSIRADTAPLPPADLDVEEHPTPRCFGFATTVVDVVFVVVVDGAFDRSSSFESCASDAIYRLAYSVNLWGQPCKHKHVTISLTPSTPAVPSCCCSTGPRHTGLTHNFFLIFDVWAPILGIRKLETLGWPIDHQVSTK